MSESRTVAVVPVGPGERELARAARLVDALARHEADLAGLILLIDGVTEATLRPHVRPGSLAVSYVLNPRRGRGSGIYDGLACGLTVAYDRIATEHPACHAWKIDSDALVMRPTSRQIEGFFEAHPTVGMAGTYDRQPDGTGRDREWVPGVEVARKFLRPVWYWRTDHKWTTSLFGRGRRFARWMRQAHAAGLPWGYHVQGGSYAINANLLAKWKADGRLSDPEAWLGAPMSEDVGFSHWTLIDGYGLANFNAPGQAFGVKGVGLPMPVDQLLAADYGVVHSVKGPTWEAELETVRQLQSRA